MASLTEQQEEADSMEKSPCINRKSIPVQSNLQGDSKTKVKVVSNW